ncbi:MAG: hypothetical protein ACK6CE_10205 [Planctomycetota bacterium]
MNQFTWFRIDRDIIVGRQASPLNRHPCLQAIYAYKTLQLSRGEQFPGPVVNA